MKKIIILISICVMILVSSCNIEEIKEHSEQQSCEKRGYYYDIWNERCTNYTLKQCHSCEQNLSRPTTGEWVIFTGSFSSGCYCITAKPILANGDYICNGTIKEYSRKLPEEFIFANNIYDVDYNIDNEMLLYIANKSDLPIVCGLEISNYKIYEVSNPTGKKCTEVREYETEYSREKIICCVKNYCSDWGYEIERYNCICDDRYIK